MELQAPVTKKATTVRRKKQDLDGIREEQRTEREERMAAKPKKLGGGKRPKAFKFNDE